MRTRFALAAILILTSIVAVHPQSSQPSNLPFPPVATFSILGFDPTTGEVGGAVQSRVFSVGNGVLWAEADVGVAATQAIVDVSYGPKALALLRAGMDAFPLSSKLSSTAIPIRGRPTGRKKDDSSPSWTRKELRRLYGTQGDDVGGQQRRHLLHRTGQHPCR
jgi:hypothetical protein